MGFNDRDDFTAIFGADNRPFDKKVKEMQGGAKAAFIKIAKFAIPATIGVTALATAVAASIAEFTKYEKALVGVAKTTNLAGEELQEFSNDIKDLSVELKGGASSRELLAIAESAGQLGVSGSRNLLAFSKTIAQLGLTTNLAGQEAAITLARILTVTGEGAEGVAQFASQLVALGNNFAATEAEIALIAQEVAKATAVFGVGSGDAAAMGAALASLGVQAEAGSTVMGKAFRAIGSAVRNGGEELERLEKITGKTGDEITRTFKNNAPQAFQFFIEGLGKVHKEGGDVNAELAEFGLIGERVLKVLPVLAKNSQLVARALNTVKQDAENGGKALKDEYAAAVDTLDAKIKNLNQRFDDLQVTIGTEFAPSAVTAVNSITEVVESLNSKLKEQGGLWELLTSAFGSTEIREALKQITKAEQLASEELLKLLSIQERGAKVQKRDQVSFSTSLLQTIKLIDKINKAKEKEIKLEKTNAEKAKKTAEIIEQHLQFQDGMNDLKNAQEILDNESVKNGDITNQQLERELSLHDKILDQKKEAVVNDELQNSLLDKQIDRQIQSLALSKKLTEESEAKAKADAAAERSKDFFSGLGQQAGSQVLGVSGAIQGGQAAGPWGAVAGAMLEIALSNEEFKKSIDELNTQIAETLSPIMEELAPINEALVDVLRAISPILKKIAPLLRFVVNALVGVIEIFAKGILLFDDVGGKMIEVFKDIIPAIQELGSFFEGLGDQIEGLGNLFEPLIDAVETLVGALGGAGGGLAGGLGGFAGSVGGALGFAEGGVVNSPTVAMAGEAGPEAFVPLKGGKIPVVVKTNSNSNNNNNTSPQANNNSIQNQSTEQRVIVDVKVKDDWMDIIEANLREREKLNISGQ